MKTKILSILLLTALCLNLLGCQAREPASAPEPAAPEVQEPQGTPATETENLVKLCKVWGYLKYTHPAFVRGKMDWDEELLKLIPQVRELRLTEEADALLHDWFISLGDLDYGNDTPASFWTLAAEEDRVIEADTSWTRDAGYLGNDLAADLAQIPAVLPSLPRAYMPSLGAGANEPEHEGVFDDPNFRLLGLFRLWNAVEYRYPYLHLVDDWEQCLRNEIPRILSGTDEISYLSSLLLMANQLHDPHIGMYSPSFDWHTILNAPYKLPIICTPAEGRLVVTSMAAELPLERGDVLLKISGRTVDELLEERKQYVSYSREEAAIYRMWAPLLYCENEMAEVTVLRGEEEVTLLCTALDSDSEPAFPDTPVSSTAPCERLEGNIGLINPAYINSAKLIEGMDSFRDTDGLIIDLRQYPDWNSRETLFGYFLEKNIPAIKFAISTSAVPGGYIKQTARYGGPKAGTYHYDKPVVVLINEESISRMEMYATILSQAENVVFLGSNTLGTDGDVDTLPLPGGALIWFTATGVYEPDDTQTQRTGIAPDIRVEPTIQGIAEGRDELLEAAVEYIKMLDKS